MHYFKLSDSTRCYIFLLKLFVFGSFNLKNSFYIGLLITVSLTLIEDSKRYHNLIEEISVLSGNAGGKSISNIN